MQFFPNNHSFVNELNRELIHLREFANEFPCLNNQDILNLVDNNTKVIFDDLNEPYVEDTTGKLLNLVNEMLEKYRNSENEHAREFAKSLDRLKRLIDSDKVNDEDLCGECIFYPFLCDKNYYHDDEIYKDIKAIRDIFLNTHKEYKIAGQYNHRERTITLYTRNIANDLEDYISVFCHEYFHALHHTILDRYESGEVLDRYYHTVVLESLATFFQIRYLRHRAFDDTADKIENGIKRHSPIFYPYSGCKRILVNNKFCDVLYETANSFENALMLLLYPDEYEARIILLMENEDCVWKTNGLNSKPQCNASNISNNSCGYVAPLASIKIYKVTQKDSFIKESACEYIFDYNENSLVSKIRKGDIIIHQYHGEIVAVSIAEEDAFWTSDINGDGKGWYVNCKYDILKLQWPIDYHPQMGYIHKLDIPFAKHIIAKVACLNDEDAIVYLIARVIDQL